MKSGKLRFNVYLAKTKFFAADDFVPLHPRYDISYIELQLYRITIVQFYIAIWQMGGKKFSKYTALCRGSGARYGFLGLADLCK